MKCWSQTNAADCRRGELDFETVGKVDEDGNAMVVAGCGDLANFDRVDLARRKTFLAVLKLASTKAVKTGEGVDAEKPAHKCLAVSKGLLFRGLWWRQKAFVRKGPGELLERLLTFFRVLAVPELGFHTLGGLCGGFVRAKEHVRRLK